MSPAPLRTNLRSPTEFDAEAVKRNGYHDQGILVVAVDDARLSWDQRVMLKQIADRFFGPRRELKLRVVGGAR